ncbi:MAG: hypothetical protein RPV21_10855 [Candidatus Sedimenticola sp. (ex Thyasira tokunagai)]
MAIYSVGAKGKDGNEYCIWIDCSSFEDAENIIEQLGLEVEPTGYGKLIEVGNIDTNEFIRMMGGKKH